MEMGATKVWGEVGRWLVIALIQLAKYVGTVEGPGWGAGKASRTGGRGHLSRQVVFSDIFGTQASSRGGEKGQ